MTPGQEALIEAMRLEQGRIYSQTQPEHVSERAGTLAVDVRQCINAGWTNSRIMAVFEVPYDAVRAARKEAMRGVAA